MPFFCSDETKSHPCDDLPCYSALEIVRVMDTVKICQEYFNFELPSSIIEKRRKTFVARCVPVS